jgi:hypothetical protein
MLGRRVGNRDAPPNECSFIMFLNALAVTLNWVRISGYTVENTPNTLTRIEFSLQ